MSASRDRVRRALVTASALLLAALLAAITVIVPVTVIARASITDGGTTGSSGIWAGVSYYWGEWVGTRSDCSWSAYLGSSDLAGLPGGQPPPRVVNGISYRLFVRICPAGNRLVWVPQAPPRLIGHWGASLLTRWLPTPPLHLAPPADRVVVHVGTWFWTDLSVWRPVSVTAWVPTPAGPLWVTTTAVPIRLELDPGDGVWGSGTVACAGPGVPWLPVFGDGAGSPFGCDYTYRHSSVVSANRSTFAAHLSVVWNVTWRASTGAAGSAGQLRTSRVAPVTVHEIEGVGVH